MEQREISALFLSYVTYLYPDEILGTLGIEYIWLLSFEYIGAYNYVDNIKEIILYVNHVFFLIWNCYPSMKRTQKQIITLFSVAYIHNYFRSLKKPKARSMQCQFDCLFIVLNFEHVAYTVSTMINSNIYFLYISSSISFSPKLSM